MTEIELLFLSALIGDAEGLDTESAQLIAGVYHGIGVLIVEQRHFAPRTVGQLTFESESSGGAGFSEVEIHAAQGEGTVAAHRELRAGSPGDYLVGGRNLHLTAVRRDRLLGKLRHGTLDGERENTASPLRSA